MGLLKLEALARLWSLLKTCTRGQLHGLLLTSSLHRLPGLPALLVRRATDVGDRAHADMLFSSFLRDADDNTAPPDAALFNAMILLPRPPRARAGAVRGNAAQGPRHRRVGSPTRTSSTRLRTRRRYGEQLHCRVLNHVQAVASSLLTFYLPGGSGSLRRLYDGLRVKAAPFPNPRKPSSAFPLPSPPPPPPAEAPATEAGAALSSAPSSSRLRHAPSSRYHEGGSGFGPQHHHRVARRPRLVILSVADASGSIELFQAVGSSLLTFYLPGGSGSLGDARRLYDGMRVKAAGLANHMMSEYAKAGEAGSMREFFDAMTNKDVASCNWMLDMHVKSGDIVAAKELFAAMPVKNVLSWTTMIRALSVAEDFTGVRSLFSQMPERNLVSWNCVLSSYTRQGSFSQALRLFPRMMLEGLTPNGYTVILLLSACEHLGKLRMGRWVHANLVTPGLQVHAGVGTALVEMYAMCGDIASAIVAFIKMGNKEVFSWNVMIKGLAVHGRAGDALRLFDLMKRQGLQPDHYTFMGVLLACSQGVLVDEGLREFDAMQKDHSIWPSLEHYGCLIDLLCRGGNIEGAMCVVLGMPCWPDSEVWRVLLGTCRIQAGLGSAEEATVSVATK